MDQSPSADVILKSSLAHIPPQAPMKSLSTSMSIRLKRQRKKNTAETKTAPPSTNHTHHRLAERYTSLPQYFTNPCTGRWLEAGDVWRRRQEQRQEQGLVGTSGMMMRSAGQIIEDKLILSQRRLSESDGGSEDNRNAEDGDRKTLLETTDVKSNAGHSHHLRSGSQDVCGLPPYVPKLAIPRALEPLMQKNMLRGEGKSEWAAITSSSGASTARGPTLFYVSFPPLLPEQPLGSSSTSRRLLGGGKAASDPDIEDTAGALRPQYQQPRPPPPQHTASHTNSDRHHRHHHLPVAYGEIVRGNRNNMATPCARGAQEGFHGVVCNGSRVPLKCYTM
eukprot:PhM_4_TR3553/c0_g1_i1/m.67850